MSNYTSKDIKKLEGIEAIRMRPGMYVGGSDEAAMNHILLEVISNSIDECLNGHGTTIEISVNTKTNIAKVSDYGRGIPFGKMDNGEEAIISIATDLHSGGKFNQGGYSVSGGLHGIGITAVNALSSKMVIDSRREGMAARVEFNQGKLKDFTIENKKAQRGTDITFTPDPEIFKDARFKYDRVYERVQLLSFLTSGVKFVLKVDNKKEVVFYTEEGLKDLVKFKAENELISNIVYIQDETDGYDIEIAFAYTNKSAERIMAFTNNIPNMSGGTHVTGFKSATTTAFNKMAKDQGFLSEEQGNLKGEHLRRGIIAAISVKMQDSPIFQGQVKDKLSSPEVRGKVSSAVTQNVYKEMTKKDTKIIIEKALLEKKAEDAAKRMREAAKKVVSGGKNLSMLKDLPAKLVDCNKDGGELFIVEGDSAGGSAADARDSSNQAILKLRGKILNTYTKELADIIENNEIKDILTSLGTGIGDKFNIKNLRYDKIILLSDADPDGAHINILIMALFLRHMPEIIKQGKLYRAVPPFYQVKKGKKRVYLQDNKELNRYIKRFGQPKELTRFKGLGEMGARQLWETTMDPEARKLVQLSTTDVEGALELFDILMGNSSQKRKEYIFENAEDVM